MMPPSALISSTAMSERVADRLLADGHRAGRGVEEAELDGVAGRVDAGGGRRRPGVGRVVGGAGATARDAEGDGQGGCREGECAGTGSGQRDAFRWGRAKGQFRSGHRESSRHRAVSRAVYIPVPMGDEPRDGVFRATTSPRKRSVSAGSRRRVTRAGYSRQMPLRRPLDQSSKLKNVLYEIRGSALDEVVRLEAEGHTILRLNTGNPAAFGFEAPHQIVRDVIAAIPHAHGYTDSRGILSARRAVVRGTRPSPASPRSTSTTSTWATACPSSSPWSCRRSSTRATRCSSPRRTTRCGPR